MYYEMIFYNKYNVRKKRYFENEKELIDFLLNAKAVEIIELKITTIEEIINI